MLAIAKTEQKLEIDRLTANWTRSAEEDALTGLPNRRAYEQRIAQALAAFNADEHLALVIIDIDHFKRVNDGHGHQTGDQVLRALAQTLKRATRDADFVGRLGGEEFVLLFRSSGMAQARQLAERALSAVRAFDWRSSCAVDAVTASSGVGLNSEALLNPTSSKRCMCLLIGVCMRRKSSVETAPWPRIDARQTLKLCTFNADSPLDVCEGDLSDKRDQGDRPRVTQVTSSPSADGPYDRLES